MTAPDFLTLFLGPLNAVAIPYMVTGSVAATIYGEPRFTQDVDLVVQLRAIDLEKMIRAFPVDAYYVPPFEVLDRESRRATGGHFNLQHLETGWRADCYMAGESALNRWGLDRRRSEIIAGEVIWIAPPEYVIISKLDYHRQGGGEKHLADVAQMLRVSGEWTNRVDIEFWVERLGLERSWHLTLEWLERLQREM